MPWGCRARWAIDVVESLRMVPIFYSFRRCPYAMRARLALDAGQQMCELREVTLRDKPEAMLRASPKGTVPVLIDVDGSVLDESLDIMLWALHRNDPERWLRDAAARDDMLSLIQHFDSHFKLNLDRYKYPDRFAAESAADARLAASADLQLLEERLMRTAYLCGEEPALADMAIVPFVRQFANVDAAWFAGQSWPRVQRWLSEIVSSTRFERVMRRVAPWIPGTSGATFPFAI